MDTKRWIIFGVIIAAAIGAMVYMSVGGRLNVDDIGVEGAANIIGPEERNGNIGDHVLGNADAKVVLVEYGDFQCPGCSSYATLVHSLVEKYGEDMALVFRNFPLTAIHPNARAAAAAAEAAGLQDKYWQMHDLLFANQTEWGNSNPTDRNEIFTNYARQIAIDETKFLADLAKENITQKINFDVALARLNNVTGTPTFLIGGETVEITANADGTISDDLENALVEALKQAGVEIEAEAETEQ